MTGSLIFYVATLGCVVFFLPPCCWAGELKPDFYQKSCPNAEKIVFDVMNNNKDKPGTIPGITRLLFHDCFITGCDASILLATSPSIKTEIAFPGNGASIRGTEVIAEAKSELERQCPGVVSCSDLLAFAARDAVVLSGNPRFSVAGGRRDSLSSHMQDATALPGPSWTVDRMAAEFGKRRIPLDGVVALLGAHSIGITRCFNTVANPKQMEAVPGADMALDPATKEAVQGKCPNLLEGTVPFNLEDQRGPWGVSYFNRTLKGKAVMPSDLALLLNAQAKVLAETYAANPKLWADKFNHAMGVMGTWNVLTGNQGEIRRNCAFVNR